MTLIMFVLDFKISISSCKPADEENREPDKMLSTERPSLGAPPPWTLTLADASYVGSAMKKR